MKSYLGMAAIGLLSFVIALVVGVMPADAQCGQSFGDSVYVSSSCGPAGGAAMVTGASCGASQTACNGSAGVRAASLPPAARGSCTSRSGPRNYSSSCGTSVRYRASSQISSQCGSVGGSARVSARSYRTQRVRPLVRIFSRFRCR